MKSSPAKIMRSGAWLAVAALAATALGATSAMARNQWANYHWEFPAGQSQLTINVNNCQEAPTGNTGNYGYDPDLHFTAPNMDWDDIIDGGTGAGAIVLNSNPLFCPGFGNFAPTADNPLGNFNTRSDDFLYDATDSNAEGAINAFNDSYGDNNWVGLAIIRIEPSSGDNHIVYGEVYLNDYYAIKFNVYDADAMRKVQCQEIGHIFGLDHVRKDNSCMYSSAAFVGSTYWPNGHDGGMVNKITDSHGGSEPPPPDDGGGKDPCAKKNPPPKCGAAGVFRGKANWAESYASRGEMYEAADLVVSARVLNGSMFNRMVGAPGRALPVSQAVLQIRATFKGKAKGVIRIEHTRGLGLEIVDDPGYVNGDDYLLYLRQIGPNTFRVLSPQGRIPQ